MADEIKFDRTPYKVTYTDLNGEKQTIRRTPPAKLHDALPTDIVRLDRKRSDDFVDGKEYEVQNVSPRQPNVLQLKRSDGQTTFVEYFDTTLTEEVALRNGQDPRDKPQNNRYLLWP